MSMEQPICLGCNVAPSWCHAKMVEDITASSSLPNFNTGTGGLTEEEKKVLFYLKEAWGSFSELKNHVPHDLNEFNYAIHMAQQKLAMRVARRIDSDVWRQP